MKTIKAIDMPMAFTFAEYFIDKDNQVVLCRIACRRSGASINQANCLLRGVDFNAWLLNALHYQQPVKIEQKNSETSGGWVVFNLGQTAAKIWHIEHTCDLPYVLDYNPTAVVGQVIYPALSNIQGVCNTVLKSEDKSQAIFL